jgi:prepilin signal peptidase PulO-like enzyme (type II secretory pathway)
MIFALIVISFWILKKVGMGLGDCKLMIVVGWVVGIKATLLTLFLASFIGGLVGILLIVTKRAERGSYIPFGPYLALGAWISYLWGDALLDWYFGLYL